MPLSVVAYPPYPWHHPVTMLRIVSPLRQAGIQILNAPDPGQGSPPADSQVSLPVSEQASTQHHPSAREYSPAANAVLIQREFPAYFPDEYQRVITRARSDGKAVIYDIDDLLLEIPPDHPDYASGYYATAYYPMLRAIQEADLVSVPSAGLLDYCRRLNPNTCLLPNYLDDRIWQPRPVRTAQGEEGVGARRLDIPEHLLIGYMGSITHASDLQAIAPALQRLLEVYPGRISFKFFGVPPPPALEKDAEWIRLELFDYVQFANYFSRQNCDIFIAPLADSHFNQCKSPLKFFEYSILGIPGVYSRKSPYAGVIEDGKDGLLASSHEEWEACLRLLIDDPERRLEMGRNAQAKVSANWMLSDHADQWRDAYQRLGLRPGDGASQPLGCTHPLGGIHPLGCTHPLSPPLASIIVLTFNNLGLTRQCLDSILAWSGDVSYELILVDNASVDGTPEYLKSFRDYCAVANRRTVTLILNESNLGFSRGINQGAAVAKGEYLVILNNDVVVTPGWLSGLLSPLRDPQVGMVGPLTNNAANEARIVVDYRTMQEMETFAARRRGENFEVQMLAFFCVALRRAVYDEIGPLDEMYDLGMFEDDDYALRLRIQGYKLICTEDVFIHHWGGAGFSSLDSALYGETFTRNLQRFEEKWKRSWEPPLYREELRGMQLRSMVAEKLQLARELQENQTALAKLDQKIIEFEIENTRLRKLLNGTFNSQGWKLLSAAQRLRARIFPLGSRRDRSLRAFGRGLSSILNFLKRNPFSRIFLPHSHAQPALEEILAGVIAAHSAVKGLAIFVPSLPWDAPLFQRPQQLALAFASHGFLVFYSETIYSEPPQIARLAPTAYRLVNVRPEIIGNAAAQFQPGGTLPPLTNHPADLVVRSPLIFTLAYNTHYLANYKRCLVVYEYIDELTVLPGDPLELGRIHDHMLRTADIVTATADILYERARRIRQDVILAPNGVDHEFIRLKLAETLAPPGDIKKWVEKKKPIIGYYGALAKWLDYDLLVKTATARPDYTFLLIGPDYDSSISALLNREGRIKGTANLIWLGAKPYSSLPAYLKYFDVAIIPFVLDDITQSTSPLKLFEYMSGQKPIVSTAIKECVKYPTVLIASDAADFAAKLDQALELRRDSGYLEELLRTASENTWEARAKQIIVRAQGLSATL